jgi:imidazolonepropionase
MPKNRTQLVIHNISQILTLKGAPQRGDRLGNLEIIKDGALLIEGETIQAVGQREVILSKYPDAPKLNASGNVVMPGFVDPHTHLLWAGHRAGEFTLRQQGKTYLEILAEGGGILSTVKATRQASRDALVRETKSRAELAFIYGTTTAEVKTGYGLDLASEIKQLEAILALDKEVPIDLVPTFLAAHAIPPEFKGRADEYVRVICNRMLPTLKDWWAANASERPLPFVDVFCERDAFNLSQSRLILETAGALGFPLKIHADEFQNLGGATLAAELGAASADHLVKTSPDEFTALAKSNTVGVSLPGTPFGLNQEEYTPASEIIRTGGLLALATDANPGTSWCESMQFILALACRKMGLTPAQGIAAATVNAAAALKLESRVGTIEPGMQADLLILSVDDYRQLGYRFGTNLVATVIKRGRPYHNNPCPEV